MTKTRLALACLLLCMSSGAFASSPNSGKVWLPCGSPMPTVRNVPELGKKCGVKITGVTQNGPFTLTPAVPADLDIHFFDANDNDIGQYALMGCGVVADQVLATATYAVVVLSPSGCGMSGQSNVKFTYSD